MQSHTRAAVIKRLEDGKIREKLLCKEQDPLLNTRASSYSANTELHPDGQILFVEKHLAYLMDHPMLDPDQYLSNLRLRLKKR